MTILLYDTVNWLLPHQLLHSIQISPVQKTFAGYRFNYFVAVAFWENVKSKTYLKSGAESLELTRLFRLQS